MYIKTIFYSILIKGAHCVRLIKEEFVYPFRGITSGRRKREVVETIEFNSTGRDTIPYF